MIAFPLVEEIAPPDIAELFVRMVALPHVLFLDSALRDPRLGRYTFLAADPFDYFETPADAPLRPNATRFLPGQSPSLDAIQMRLAPFAAAPAAGLPPFQGGAAGLLGYDLGQEIERLPRPRHDEFRWPRIALGLYDVVLAFDHVEDRAWIISQGFPEFEPARRQQRAERRLKQAKQWLGGAIPESPTAPSAPTVEPHQLAPQFSVRGPRGLTSNFSDEAYLRAVQRAIEYIYAGDIFQVNLAQRLLCPAQDSSVALYLRLRERNPAPFAGYFDLGDRQIISASPERFLQVRDRRVEARPIKGTRPRTLRPEADLFAADELRASEKDRAENVMIVDLLRNDLGRVCRPGSVVVSQLCQVETYSFVQHLVSAVEGELRAGLTAIDLLRGAFPGGSITGAPKVRAMEIIAELEPTARGPYCGSLGYIGFDGGMDLNILIRTIAAAGGWWQAPVGGGIVAESDPRREYEETWHKAEGMLRALA